tara:strand:+ start:605 stop:754 length:150 start_codon:yes stop_codon:yes gene_type:complete
MTSEISFHYQSKVQPRRLDAPIIGVFGSKDSLRCSFEKNTGFGQLVQKN